MQSPSPGYDIAVIGLAGRFPGAANVDQYWRNLRAGAESVRFFTQEELRKAGEAEQLLNDPHYVKAQPVLDGFDQFDASFFGFAPQDAAIMDPQHRLFLEVGWEALEDAGHLSESFAGNIGVFATCGMNTYMMYNLVNNRRLMETIGEWLVRHTGNDMNFLATRLSYELNLRGPSMNVQTACSSALVAIHLACLSLLSGECDLALAGGSTIVLPQNRGYLYKPNEILSPDGHCRPFDAQARGTLFGSGAGVVVLRRLADALADGDRVLAVIRGSAINNDGSGKVGYLAPSVEGQSKVIIEALTVGGVHPETISYVEAHGTGTIVGDPIEVVALTQAYRHFTEKKGFCALGSVKSNIGHLGEAAGVAAFIKTVLALQNRLIPATLHYQSPNPQIDFANSPFFVNATAVPWHCSTGPRRAGITSLGAGGTNCHVIVEEPPALPPSGTSRRWQLVLLSAASQSALEKATENLARHVQESPELSLPDSAYTLHVGRKAFAHRRALVCCDRDELMAACEAGQRLLTSATGSAGPKIAFLFPGQGAQYPNMGRGLYESEPIFRAEVDRGLEILQQDRGLDFREVLFTSGETALAQPALFLIEYALAKLWIRWGVKPYAMLGHSIGEYVGACLAGVFSFPDAIRLVADRGRLMQQAPRGAMLAVALPAEEVQDLLARTAAYSELALAVLNGPEQSVVAGPEGPIAALAAELSARGIPCRRLETSHAFHSPMMDPILASYRERVRRVRLCPPAIPYLSNLTGTWIRPEEATDPDYWVLHLRNPVRFSECLSALLANRDQVLLEVGPGRTLGGLAGRQKAEMACPVFHSLGRPGEDGRDIEMLLRTAGQLWEHGCSLDAAGIYEGQRRRRVALPTYPFERQRFWIEPDAPAALNPSNQLPQETLSGKRIMRDSAASEPDAPARDGFLPGSLASASGSEAAELHTLIERTDVADWFYLPNWKRSLRPPTSASPPDAPGDWLVFLDECGVGASLVEELQKPRADKANRDAVRLELAEPGNIDSLTIRPDERREPRPGEVEIRVCAAALNFADVLKATGVFAEAPFGMECAGVIERVGHGVTEFRRGDEVVAIGPDSFRSYLIRPAQHVARKPEFLSMEEVVTFPAAFMTAWYALHHQGALCKGERVLIHAASGGVGLAAVQVAQLAGAEIFATAGSKEKRAFLKSLGIRHVFDSRSLGFADEIQRRTRGAGVDLVLNSLTGEFIPKSLSLLAPGGRFLELGKREIYSPAQLAALALGPNVSYRPINLTQLCSDDPAAYGRLLGEVVEQVEGRRFQPLPRQVFAFSKSAAAFRLMLQTRHIGKVVLTMAASAPAVYSVRQGTQFQQLNKRQFILQPGNPGHYKALLDALNSESAQVGHIAHFWSVTTDASTGPGLERCLERGFSSLTWLAKALGSREWTHPIDLSVISTGLHQVGGEAPCQPAKATLLGPCRVIPRELPNITCRSIDVPATTAGSWQRERLVAQLSAELLAEVRDKVIAYRNTDRWVQDLEPAPLADRSPPHPLTASLPHPLTLSSRIREGGVYLITGGLGDLGLEFAEYFARAAKANLILISRSTLPPRFEWEEWLGSHGGSDRTSMVIRRLQACEATGGNVMVVAADVTDRRRMRAVIAEARKRFGAIHGVIHAAGSLDDGLIQLKTAESAMGILAPKVVGTLILDELLGGQPLDFFVLFSSISSFLGLQGQVDYTAANAFLDAFASSRAARCAGQTVAINWSAWRDVGMAARTIRSGHDPHSPASATRPTHHPCLECRCEEDSGAVTFVTAFSRARHWLLDEHALRGGEALIPGTGFLELARAAFADWRESGQPVEMTNVVFQAPFAVAKEETKELRLTLRRAEMRQRSETQGGDATPFAMRGADATPLAVWDFSFTSQGGGITHATGRIAAAPPSATKRIDIPALSGCCRARSEVLGGQLRQSFMDFGPRWANVRRIDYGRDEALLTLELPAAFVSDLDFFALHPALLDMATGGAQALIPSFDATGDFYVPFSYGRLLLWNRFSSRLYSHVRLRDAQEKRLAVFDVTIADERGTVLAEVSDFIMKRVSQLATGERGCGPGRGAESSSAPPAALRPLRQPRSPLDLPAPAAALAGEILQHGIEAAKGIEAFERILAWGVAPQVIVSPVDPRHWLNRAGAMADRDRAAAMRAPTSAQAPSAPPGGALRVDSIERRLQELYAQLLGVPNVGPHDDFFELGGHSLLAVRLLTRIEMEFKKVIPLAKLFQTPTIEGLAAVLRDTQKPKRTELDIIVPFNEQGQAPPLYFVHSLTGEVVSFRHLARLLGPQQKFYAIQAPPEMQTGDCASSIEAIAGRYVDAILSFQPEGPCLLGGWSAGSTIALEMAQQLTAQGRTVQLLIALDGAPFNTNSGTSLYSPKYYWKLVRNLPYWVADDLLVNLSLRPLVRRFRNKVMALSERLANALRRRRASYRQVSGFLDVSYFSPNLAGYMNALYDALCAYVPKPYNGRVLLYKSRSEPLYHLLEVERAWQKIAAHVDVVVVRGTHVSVVSEPYVHAVADDLRKRLAAM